MNIKYRDLRNMTANRAASPDLIVEMWADV